MRIRADEHVSPEIVRIICELALNLDFELSSVFNVGHDGSPDEYWVTEFAKDGGDAILTADTDFFSADTDFFRKPNQLVAIDRTGLRVIHLHSRWANARARLQAAHILMWWPRIEAKLREARPREVWLVQWNINETGELKRKKVDYSAAHKKLRKAKRRSK